MPRTISELTSLVGELAHEHVMAALAGTSFHLSGLADPAFTSAMNAIHEQLAIAYVAGFTSGLVEAQKVTAANRRQRK